MTTALALQDTTRSLPPWVSQRVSSMTSDYPPRLPAGMALTVDQRREVSATIEALGSCLAPGSKRELGAVVLKLLAVYPADGASSAMQQARSEAWLDALEGIPAWAAEEARRKWMRGEVPGVNPDFAPKPPRFRKLAESLLEPIHEQRSKLNLLLKAKAEKPITPEERARVAAKLDQFRAEFGLGLNETTEAAE